MTKIDNIFGFFNLRACSLFIFRNLSSCSALIGGFAVPFPRFTVHRRERAHKEIGERSQANCHSRFVVLSLAVRANHRHNMSVKTTATRPCRVSSSRADCRPTVAQLAPSIIGRESCVALQKVLTVTASSNATQVADRHNTTHVRDRHQVTTLLVRLVRPAEKLQTATGV